MRRFPWEIILFSAIGGLILVLVGYPVLEPLEINAASATATTTVYLTVSEEITLTPPSDISMSPNIGLTTNSSIGTGDSWNVKTNAANGYTLTLKDDSIPALQSGSNSFSDATTSAPQTWGFSSGQSCSGLSTCFGFSVFGNDVNSGTWGTGSNCGSGGTPSGTLKYRGFNGTTTITVASKNQPTSTAGATTTLCVAAAQNDVFAPQGNYQTIVTGTATTN